MPMVPRGKVPQVEIQEKVEEAAEIQSIPSSRGGGMPSSRMLGSWKRRTVKGEDKLDSDHPSNGQFHSGWRDAERRGRWSPG